MIDIDKINRFTELIEKTVNNDKIIAFYNEILSQIENMIGYIDQLEEDNSNYHFSLLKEKHAREKMQIFIGMILYMSNTGDGAAILEILTKDIDNYFIRDEKYYNNMTKLINNVRIPE